MKNLLLFLSILNLSASAQHWSFQTCIGDYGNGEPKSVAVDNNGEIISCGVFTDTLYMSSGNILSGGMEDAYLIKYDSSGNIDWNIILNGAFDDEFIDIAIDDSNNVYVTGTISDTVQIQNVTLIPSGGNNGVLFKFSPDGQLMWHIQGTGNCFNRQVAVDKRGIVYFTGLVNITATFGGILVTNTAGIYNSYLFRCSSHTGFVLDGFMISASGDYGANEMVVDSLGEIYIAGHDRPVNSTYVNLFMRRLASSTSAGWSYDMESPSGDCYGYGVALDPFEKVYFTGYIYNNVTFQGNQFGTFGRYKNAVLCKFDTSGTLDWARNYGTSSPDMANSIACDDSGNVFWTGSFEDSITISNSIFTSTNPLWADAFLVKMDSSGNVLWNKNIGGNFNEYPVQLSYNSRSNVLGITGTFAAPALFDSVQLANVRGQDVFVARLGLPSSMYVGINHPENKNIESKIFIVGDDLFINTNVATKCTFYLTDLSGRQIKNGLLKDGIGQINISKLSTGVYFVSIVADEISFTKKIIID